MQGIDIRIIMAALFTKAKNVNTLNVFTKRMNVMMKFSTEVEIIK